jgi:hypothetical protein
MKNEDRQMDRQTYHMKKEFGIFDKRLSRNVFGHKRNYVTKKWRKVRNFELSNRNSSSHIVSMII